MSTDSILLGFVGDLLVDRSDGSDPFADVRTMLAAPDVLFGNLEGSFSARPQPLEAAGVRLVAGESNLHTIAGAGFDVLSMANNHSLDAGHDALLDTLWRLQSAGVKTCGAGHDLQAARAPARVHSAGASISFLAYASVFPLGYEARAKRPGVAPLRSRDTYLRHRDYYLPGTFPHIRSRHDKRDLDALVADIEQAKARSDMVVASFHWGDTLHPYLLTDHERRTARLCIDHGVDMVVGHHHHLLRGIEWYRGRPIVYGLGHFVFDCRLQCDEPRLTGYEHAVFPREGWPLLPMHADARMTMMACASVRDGRVQQLGFVPCRLLPDGRVRAVRPRSQAGREVLAYVQRCNLSQGLNGRIDASRPWPVGNALAVPVLPLDG